MVVYFKGRKIDENTGEILAERSIHRKSKVFLDKINKLKSKTLRKGYL